MDETTNQVENKNPAENTSPAEGAKQTNKERLKEITDGIEQGIKELFQSDRYRTYLSVMSRFHRYSVNNTMLIYMQRPTASLVAGFQKWQNQFGRHVKKGERGITIIAPTPFKKKIEEVKLDPDTKAPMLDAEGRQIMVEREISIPMFKPVKVFDVAQTYGKPLPQLAATLSGAVKEYDIFLEALRRAAAIPVSFQPIAQNTDGFFSLTSQSITIREGMSEVQTICALVHEIAHSRLHNYEKQRAEAAAGEESAEPVRKDSRTEEVEAESVSYTVCKYFGIETGENSFGYIASWSRGKELKELRDSLETINKTASGLITDIDNRILEVCRERGIDPKTLMEPEAAAGDYKLVAASIYDHLKQLKDERKLEPRFLTMEKEEFVAALADILRKGHFDTARKTLRDAANNTGEPVPEALLNRLELCSDEWDKGLTYRLEHSIFDGEVGFLHAAWEDISDETIFTGPISVCEKLMTELTDGTMTARQARALSRQWERAENLPAGEPEKLWLLDQKQYLHIQTTDEGYDYTLYDAETLRGVDGGQFSADIARMHMANTLMDCAFREVCVLQGLEPKRAEPVPLEKLEEITETNALPVTPETPESQQAAPTTDDLPDPTITPEMIERYGYSAQDILPLSQDRALELAERDMTIYALSRDGSAEMVFDASEIMQHKGIFGITREEWESAKADVPPRDVEKRFLDKPEDAYAIYQLKADAPPDLLFVEWDRLEAAPDRANYTPIYTDTLLDYGDTKEKLESLFQMFNIDRPGDFFGHSLSVSDIVALKQNGDVSYHYCDSVGFRELPDFNRRENAQGLEADRQGPGHEGESQHPSVAELEAQVKAGQSISLMDLAHAVQAEDRAERTAKAEKPSILERLKQPIPKQEKKTAPQRSAEKEL